MMLRVGLKLDNYMYSCFIRVLSECGRESEVREVFSLMERYGCVSDLYIKCVVEEFGLRMSGFEREIVLVL